MRRTLTVVLILCLLVGWSGLGRARGFGSGRVITMPTADTLPSSYLNLNYSRIGIDPASDLLAFNYGIKDDIQFGGRIAWRDEISDPKIYPGFKVNLLPERGRYQPMVSIGAEGWSDNLYAAASKLWPRYNLRAHLAVGDKGVIDDGLALGVSKVLNPVVISSEESSFSLPETKLEAEYNGGFNLGAEFKFNSGLIVEAGVADLNSLWAGLSFENKF